MQRNQQRLPRTFVLTLLALAVTFAAAPGLHAAKDPCLGLAAQNGSLQFPNLGGTNAFQVQVGPDCRWVVTGALSWLGFTPASGLGGGTVFVTAQPNFDPFPRGAMLWLSPVNGSYLTGPVAINVNQS